MRLALNFPSWSDSTMIAASQRRFWSVFSSTFSTNRAGPEPLEAELADRGEHFHAALSALELLVESRRVGDITVALRAVPPEAVDQLPDLRDRERLRQVVVRAVAETEDGRVHRRDAG